MSPKPKPVPKRLGPPPQLLYGGPGLKGDIFSKIPMVQQQRKLQPKMHEIMSKQAKMIARWLHENLTWKKILMTWMVVLVASKMVLLMLTFEYFSLTALISLQVRTVLWFNYLIYNVARILQFQLVINTMKIHIIINKLSKVPWLQTE